MGSALEALNWRTFPLTSSAKQAAGQPSRSHLLLVKESEKKTNRKK